MTFTKILVATDFSPGAERALRMAARLAAAPGAELVVAHAWHMPAFYIAEGLPGYVTQDMIDESQRALAAAVEMARTAGAHAVRGILLQGAPWAELVEELGRHAYDLCVIGTHGRTGIARALLGSVAEMVVRHAPCSVLAVRQDAELAPFLHVLVATDFSERARFAHELAPQLVGEGGAISLLHVVEVPPIPPTGTSNVDVLAGLDTRAARLLDEAAAELRARADRPVATLSRIGSPITHAIAAIDADRSIDLLVMGSHGRTGLPRALLGSVAEQLVRHARCSVLVARRRA